MILLWTDSSYGDAPILPPVEMEPSEAQWIDAQLRVFVRGFALIGNTVFTKNQLEQALANYSNRTIFPEDLESA